MSGIEDVTLHFPANSCTLSRKAGKGRKVEVHVRTDEVKADSRDSRWIIVFADIDQRALLRPEILKRESEVVLVRFWHMIERKIAMASIIVSLEDTCAIAGDGRYFVAYCQEYSRSGKLHVGKWCSRQMIRCLGRGLRRAWDSKT